MERKDGLDLNEMAAAATSGDGRRKHDAIVALVARVRELEARASLPVIATCDAPRLYTREEVLAYGEQVRAHMGDGLACGSADEYLPDAALSALLDAVKPLRVLEHIASRVGMEAEGLYEDPSSVEHGLNAIRASLALLSASDARSRSAT